MRGMVDHRLYRAVAPYTIGLWIAGFVWLTIATAGMGRMYGLLGMLTILPYAIPTVLLGLALQALILESLRWNMAWRVVAIGVAAMGGTLLSGFIDTKANYWVAQHLLPEMREWASGTFADWMQASFIYSWVYCFNVAVVLLVVATEKARDQAGELRAALDAAQVARLTMLRYQLNPHFLFNSLNALSSLVLTRQNEQAEQMIDRLSAFLRSSASSDPTTLVPLAEELATIEEYLEVEGIRFGNRMAVDYAIAANAGDMLVPSFLLQPVVENAIKYAVAPARGRVTLRIEAEERDGRLRLCVRDDGDAVQKPAGGSGIGLTNVRSRLGAFFAEDATLTAGPTHPGYAVEIVMPARRPG